MNEVKEIMAGVAMGSFSIISALGPEDAADVAQRAALIGASLLEDRTPLEKSSSAAVICLFTSYCGQKSRFWTNHKPLLLIASTFTAAKVYELVGYATIGWSTGSILALGAAAFVSYQIGLIGAQRAMLHNA